MNLAAQVASLDLCKRLKELGVKQEGFFYWVKMEEWQIGYLNKDSWLDHEMCAAFTVAELGEMLPPRTSSFKDDRGWNCERDNNSDGYISSSGGDTEADARAKYLLYLLENKLAKPEGD